MARGAIVAARRRGTVLVAALAGCLASACAGERATRPARPAGGGIAATVSVDAATPGLQVQLSAFSAGRGTLLGRQTISLDSPGQPAASLDVDLTPCLAESDGASCSLRLTGTLLSPSDQPLDQAEVGPIALAPGETKTLTDPLVLREVNRIVITPPTPLLEVGKTVTLTATPMNALDEPVARPPAAWSSTGSTVVSVSADGLVTAHASGGPVTISASVGQRVGTMVVSVVTPPSIRVAPAAVALTVNSGETTPRQATVNVTNAGQAPLPDLQTRVVHVTPATPPRPWLAAALNSTTAPAQLTLTADPTGLPGGTTYVADVGVSSSTRTDVAEVMVRVTMTVLQEPAIGLAPTVVNFAAAAGSPPPAAQTVEVTNTGTGTLDGLSIQSVVDPETGRPPSPDWLSVQLSGASAPASLILRPLTTTPEGTYAARVAIASTAPGVTNSPQYVDVFYEVTAPLVLVAAPSSLTFTAAPNGALPTAQSVSLTSSGPGEIDGLRVTAVSEPWLQASLGSPTTSTQLSVQPGSTNLAPGSHTATITLASTTMTGVSPRTVDVTYTVTGVHPLTVTGAGTGSGTVVSNPAGISCNVTNGSAGGTCGAAFAQGATVSLAATPESGSTFAGWGGACSGTGSCLVTMTQARSVVAEFTASASAVAPLLGGISAAQSGAVNSCIVDGVAYTPFRVTFSYSDQSGDVLSGSTLLFTYTWSDGITGSRDATAEMVLTGNGFAGTITHDQCIFFASTSYIDFTYQLTDLGENQSAPITVRIPRPPFANSVKPGVARMARPVPE